MRGHMRDMPKCSLFLWYVIVFFVTLIRGENVTVESAFFTVSYPTVIFTLYICLYKVYTCVRVCVKCANSKHLFLAVCTKLFLCYFLFAKRYVEIDQPDRRLLPPLTRKHCCRDIVSVHVFLSARTHCRNNFFLFQRNKNISELFPETFCFRSFLKFAELWHSYDYLLVYLRFGTRAFTDSSVQDCTYLWVRLN